MKTHIPFLEEFQELTLLLQKLGTERQRVLAASLALLGYPESVIAPIRDFSPPHAKEDGQ